MRYGSLCTGVGGLDLAVEATFGAELAWYSEIDKDACKVLGRHWPEVPNLGNLSEVEWDDVQPVDLICSGPPCQPVSQAGRRKGARDERWLWDDVLDVVGRLRPRWCIFENPYGVAPWLSAILYRLARLGYVGSWRVLGAADIGACHQRDRFFVVAVATGVVTSTRMATGTREVDIGDGVGGGPVRGRRVLLAADSLAVGSETSSGCGCDDDGQGHVGALLSVGRDGEGDRSLPTTGFGEETDLEVARLWARQGRAPCEHALGWSLFSSPGAGDGDPDGGLRQSEPVVETAFAADASGPDEREQPRELPGPQEPGRFQPDERVGPADPGDPVPVADAHQLGREVAGPLRPERGPALTQERAGADRLGPGYGADAHASGSRRPWPEEPRRVAAPEGDGRGCVEPQRGGGLDAAIADGQGWGPHHELGALRLPEVEEPPQHEPGRGHDAGAGDDVLGRQAGDGWDPGEGPRGGGALGPADAVVARMPDGSTRDYGPSLRRHAAVLGRSWPEPLYGRSLNGDFSEWMMMLPEGWLGGVSNAAKKRLAGNACVPLQGEVAIRLLVLGLASVG